MATASNGNPFSAGFFSLVPDGRSVPTYDVMNRSLRMHVRPILGEPTLVLAFEGWNDACESASSTVRFVDDVVRTVPLAEIDPDDFYDFTVRRPEVRYQAGRASAIHWPANEFRYGVTADGRELVTGLGRRAAHALAELLRSRRRARRRHGRAALSAGRRVSRRRRLFAARRRLRLRERSRAARALSGRALELRGADRHRRRRRSRRCGRTGIEILAIWSGPAALHQRDARIRAARWRCCARSRQFLETPFELDEAARTTRCASRRRSRRWSPPTPSSPSTCAN